MAASGSSNEGTQVCLAQRNGLFRALHWRPRSQGRATIEARIGTNAGGDNLVPLVGPGALTLAGLAFVLFMLAWLGQPLPQAKYRGARSCAPCMRVRSMTIQTREHLAAGPVSALFAMLAFALYWLSAFALEARDGTMHFHADTWLYSELAEDNLFDRIVPDSQLARVFRFHPTTVVLAAGWMKIVKPLSTWIMPLHLLKGLFAAVGALGVWAAMQAFAAVVPRRHVLLWGAIYASSLGVWYFSSIEESKIVTATLSGLYIATYLHLRTNWT